MKIKLKDTNLPAILVVLFGCHIGVCGAVVTHVPTIQWISNLLPLNPLPHDEQVRDLKTYYQTFNPIFVYKLVTLTSKNYLP